MPITLLASACPPVPTPGGFSSNGLSVYASTPTPHVYEGVTFGESLTWPGKTQRNAVRDEIMGRSGAGWYAVTDGLTLTAGTGLLPSVAAGHAMIDAPVELKQATTVGVPDNTAHTWIWLLRTGLLYASVTTALPPSPGVLLGSVTTSGGAVTAVDTSGVLAMAGGMAQRQTADAGAPTDTPPAGTQFVAITAGGTYFWNGAAYVSFPAIASIRTKITLAAKSLTVTPGSNYVIGADFSGVGHFADPLYTTALISSDPLLMVTPHEGSRTTGKAFWTLHYQGTGSAVGVTVTAQIKGEGWTGATTTGLAATWDALTSF